MTPIDALRIINGLSTTRGTQAYHQWKLTNVQVTAFDVNASGN